MTTYKTYKTQRYLFFWLAIIVYFVPFIVATSCLLPFMRESTGSKVAIGLAVVLLNSIPFIGGIFRHIFSHFPFINVLSVAFLCLAGFFTLDLFSDYVSSFCVIEACAFVGSVAACVFWALHNKYKRQAQTVATVIKSGVLEANNVSDE